MSLTKLCDHCRKESTKLLPITLTIGPDSRYLGELCLSCAFALGDMLEIFHLDTVSKKAQNPNSQI